MTRRGSTLLAGVVLVAACSRSSSGTVDSTVLPSPSPPPVDAAPASATPYLTDAHFRRNELVASLVDPTNQYTTLRLAHYDTGDAADWSRLPEWNPRTETIAPGDLDAPGGASANAALGANARERIVGEASPGLLALGEEAFFHYPAQLARVATALTSRDAAKRYGLWIDDGRGVGGIVRVEMADGTRGFAYTCATCHVRQDGASLVIGVGNEHLDLGRMFVDGSRSASREIAARYLAWGPGRVDVTTSLGTEPMRIPDLRPTRWLTFLQQGAAVAQPDVETLAIRLETLIVTSNNMVLRPPREITLALATYVWSLSAALPAHPLSSAQERHGGRAFAKHCGGCHTGPGYTGHPVPVAAVGTDPRLGLSTTRGTGKYRVPSLRGVSSRGMLLHDASLPCLDALLDPARVSPAYRGGRLGPGAVPGHVFGLDLSDEQRAELVTFLRTL